MNVPVQQFPLGDAMISVIHVGMGRWIMSDQMRPPAAGWPTTAVDFVGQKLAAAFQCVHIRLGAASVLVDAMDFREYVLAHGGTVSPEYNVPRVDQQLAHLGIAPESLTHVVITHAHDDHYILATIEDHGQRVPLFPNAMVIAERADWTPAGQQAILAAELEEDRDPDAPDRYMGEIQRRNQLHLVDGDAEIAPGITLIHTPGESPGHAVVRVQSQGQTLYCLGDLIHHPIELTHLDWVPLWADPVQTVASRQRIFTAALAKGALYIAAHIPGVGRLRATATGIEWEPVIPLNQQA